jgi:predicted PhzF superfamily epimerase YddE/YHI9
MYGDAGEQGGYARVHYLGAVSASAFDRYASSLLGSLPVLDSTEVLVAAAESGFTVESYSANGRQIQFCGHGALAAAFVVFDQIAGAVESVSFANHYQGWQGRQVAPDAIALSYSKPEVVGCAIPEFAEQVLGTRPLAAAASGGSAGYLILVMPDAAAVRNLQPDLQRLAQSSACALIVTAFDETEATCFFRYFAPQYGTPEDSATGSAAVQLAAFWQSQSQISTIRLKQLSATGAWLAASCHGAQVELSARVGYR